MKAILGEKKQMTRLFSDDGTVIPVTIIDVNSAIVAGTKTVERDGYTAAVIGFGKKSKATKAETGKFKSLGFVPQVAMEAREFTPEVQSGEALKPTMFEINEKINISGITKGKGFQGVVKRWGFHGGPKTHGQSDRHRAPGSIGSGTTPGRVYKGKKMAGRMGGVTRTVRNLVIVAVDEANGLIAVKGAVPGAKGSIVMITSVN
ncbi:MAG: 50S ribosomal protein L3 [candidate division WS6 bacterium OLB20]|uniref:Large ribosomal subunit protein uL3 n=1 Tax=candidate division WS6 bacterium OLB20 TaxID=1617426 RepID=A0A136LX06_9BACT|nr:MAG: 50S ribosomal protein L3 [candidate division WS6 bacterium OLB20]